MVAEPSPARFASAETWLTSETSASEVTLPGCFTIKVDCLVVRMWHRVFVCVHLDITVHQMNRYADSEGFLAALGCLLRTFAVISDGVVYTFLETNFIQIFQELCLILGDFLTPHMDWNRDCHRSPYVTVCEIQRNKSAGF